MGHAGCEGGVGGRVVVRPLEGLCVAELGGGDGGAVAALAAVARGFDGVERVEREAERLGVGVPV